MATALEPIRTGSAELPRKLLGRTGMQITRVGLGAWAMGGPDWLVGWGPQDDAASIATIRRAVERGINWIDTAAIYGLGHSEDVIRRALAEMPSTERPYVFTKCGQVWDEADRNTKFRVGRPESIRAECEASLRRLGVEIIDLYQMHWPAEDGTPLEEYWQTLADLRREGKVRAIGLSNHDVSQAAKAASIASVDTLQPPLSAIHRNTAATHLAWCRDHDVGVVVYSPMQSGLLAGRLDRTRVANLPASDWRSRHPDFSSPAIERNLAVAAAMRTVAGRLDVSTAAVAIAWVLTWPGVSGAIVGARHPDQIDDWIAAADLALDPTDLDLIADTIVRHGAGEGPVHPLR